MRPKQKIKLYIETFPNTEYSLSPNYTENVDSELKVYVFDHDPKSITNIKVKLNYGKIIIKKIMCDDTHLILLDKFGVYKTTDNKVLYNRYGYMDTPGTYTFKIRFGGSVFHYMLYMLEKFSLPSQQ